MGMFEQIGEFTPDSLIASPDFPILKEGIGLKPGQIGLGISQVPQRQQEKAGTLWHPLRVWRYTAS